MLLVRRTSLSHIEARRGELAIRFQHDHGRPPAPLEALHLAQQATLETRDAKHEPRSLAEQRATWLNEAAAVLDGAEAVASMVRTALAPPAETARIADSHWVVQTADHILTVMEASRSTWQMWHVRAEAQRQVRTIDLPAENAAALVDLLVDEVLARRSVALAARHDGIEEPEALRRVDGSSVTTSIAVSPSASTTTSVALTSESGSLLQAGTKIDTACPDHPRTARTHHPRRPSRSTAAKSRVCVCPAPIPAGQKATPGRLPTANLAPSDQGRAPPGQAARVLAALRVAPRRHS